LRFSLGIPVAVVLASQTTYAQERNVGEPCGARADCHDGLRCLRNVCVDEATFDSFTALQSRNDQLGAPGFRGYVGGSFGGMLPVSWGQIGVGVQPAVQVGVLNEHHVELQLQVSGAYLAGLGTPTAAFDAVGTVGYLAPLNPWVGWIVRVGAGGGFVIASGGTPCFECTVPAVTAAFAEFRFDVVGVAIRTSRHVELEFNAPSFRLMYLPSRNVNNALVNNNGNGDLMLTWVTSVAANYVF
jgi:hypothetical protein